jgi:hypothetical protein
MCASDIDKAMIFYRRLFGYILITRDSTPPEICGSGIQFAFAHAVHCMRNWLYLPLL